MSVRGELFTTQVLLNNRSYFFNVKENRTGDVFLQIVESKNREGSDFDRHQIAIFAEDLQKFLKGMDDSLSFIEKERKNKAKSAIEKKAYKQEKYGKGYKPDEKRIYHKKTNAGVKHTGKVIHIVSKRNNDTSDKNN